MTELKIGDIVKGPFGLDYMNDEGQITVATSWKIYEVWRALDWEDFPDEDCYKKDNLESYLPNRPSKIFVLIYKSKDDEND